MPEICKKMSENEITISTFPSICKTRRKWPAILFLFFPPFSQHPSRKYLIKTLLVNLQILINTIQIKIDKNYKPWIHTERDAHKVPMCAPSTIQYRSWMKEGSPQVRAVRVRVYQGCFHGHVCNPQRVLSREDAGFSAPVHIVLI